MVAFPSVAMAHPVYGNTWAKGIVTDKRQIAITIDDITDANMRSTVDLLVKYHLKATLFIIGSQTSVASIRYALAHGMEVESHGWDHVGINTLTANQAGGRTISSGESSSSVVTSESVGTIDASGSVVATLPGMPTPGPVTSSESSESINKTRNLIRAAGSNSLWYRSPYENYDGGGLKRAWATGVFVAGATMSMSEYRSELSSDKRFRTLFVKQLNNKSGNILLTHRSKTLDRNLAWLAKNLKSKRIAAVTLNKMASTGYPTSDAKYLKKLRH
jgi:peptidoglycan/xylan/chitin deacetylase (PgdA/CDA1 family)